MSGGNYSDAISAFISLCAGIWAYMWAYGLLGPIPGEESATQKTYRNLMRWGGPILLLSATVQILRAVFAST